MLLLLSNRADAMDTVGAVKLKKGFTVESKYIIVKTVNRNLE